MQQSMYSNFFLLLKENICIGLKENSTTQVCEKGNEDAFCVHRSPLHGGGKCGGIEEIEKCLESEF